MRTYRYDTLREGTIVESALGGLARIDYWRAIALTVARSMAKEAKQLQTRMNRFSKTEAAALLGTLDDVLANLQWATPSIGNVGTFERNVLKLLPEPQRHAGTAQIVPKADTFEVSAQVKRPRTVAGQWVVIHDDINSEVERWRLRAFWVAARHQEMAALVLDDPERNITSSLEEAIENDAQLLSNLLHGYEWPSQALIKNPYALDVTIDALLDAHGCLPERLAKKQIGHKPGEYSKKPSPVEFGLH